MYRPETFSEFKGNSNKVAYICNKINNNQFPNVVLLLGVAGIGKTSLAKLIAKGLSCNGTSSTKPCNICSTCKEITEKVIRNNKDTRNVLTFTAQSDDKTFTENIKTALNTSFLREDENKVIIIEEAHLMLNKQQNDLLTVLEYLPERVYLIMTATDILSFNNPFLSRVFQITLNQITFNELKSLLIDESERRKLLIENKEAVFSMIANYADNQPRMALKLLEALGCNCKISMDDLKDFISYPDLTDLLLLTSSLNNSILKGITLIDTMEYSIQLQKFLIDFLEDCIKIKYGIRVTKYKQDQYMNLVNVLKDLDIILIARFLYKVTSIVPSDFCKRTLLGAYLSIHPKIEDISINAGEKELVYKTNNPRVSVAGKEVAPLLTIDDLLEGGKVLQ